MDSKFLRKYKFPLIAACSACVIAGATTPLIVSCSNEKYHDIGEFDKTYHVDDIMYKRLEKQIESVYRATLHDKDPEVVKNSMQRLKDDLTGFRERQNTEKLSYSVITNSLLKHVADKYEGLNKIERDFSEHPIDWIQQISELNTQLRHNLRDRLAAYGMPSTTISTNMRSFDNKFSTLSARLNAEYSDPLLKFVELKSQIYTCFSDMTEHFSYLAAQAELKNFLGDHSFSIVQKSKKNNDEPIYWDVLKEQLKVGSNISNFIENNCSVYFKKTKKTTTDFKLSEMINGYHIFPILKGWKKDIDKNTYSMLVDWELISDTNYNNSLKNPEIRIKTAAHSAVLKDEKKYEYLSSSGDNYAKDFANIPDSEKQFSVFSLSCSPGEEVNNIRDAYLKNLEFDWDKTNHSFEKPYPNCAYENFFNFYATDSSEPIPTRGYLDQKALSRVGLTVKDKTNKDSKPVRVDKILNDIKNEGKTTSEKLPDTLIYRFFKNCGIESYTDVTDDNLHIVNTTLYAGYLTNSRLRPQSSTGPSRRAKIDDDLNCRGIPLSKKLYDNSYKTFKPIKEWTDKVSKISNYKDIHAPYQKASLAFSIITGLIISTMAISLFLIIIGKAPASVPLIVTSSVAIGISIVTKAELDGFGKRVADHEETNIKILMHETWSKLSEFVWNDNETIYKSYQVFKNHSFLSIRGKSLYYAGFKASHYYQDFYQKTDYPKIDINEMKKLKSEFIGIMVQSGILYTAAITGYIITLRIAARTGNPAAIATEAPTDTSNALVSTSSESMWMEIINSIDNLSLGVSFG